MTREEETEKRRWYTSLQWRALQWEEKERARLKEARRARKKQALRTKLAPVFARLRQERAGEE